MRKKLFVMVLIIVLLVCIFSPAVYAAEAKVMVKLPAFRVTLNGITIENKFSRYPLIVYKDITYFPMTYYDCRFLGLESVWNSSTGLEIAKTGVNWGYHKEQTAVPNSNTYTAKVASLKVKVNGKTIDNGREEYPLLFFRNITYFPLTWKFAVEEFGWDYSFAQENGLVINSAESGVAAGQLTLPIAVRENGEKGAFTMAGDYFYYEGSQGKIYQAPIANSSKAKQVYQLPTNGYNEDYVFALLKTENGKALLQYHTGGATMGSDHLIWLKEDGTAEDIDHGYFALKIYDDYTIRVNHSFMPIQNNLQVKKSGDVVYKSVGSPDYFYGRLRSKTTSSWTPSYDLYLIGEEIYVLGYYAKDDPNSTTGIYKVNLHTGLTERVCAEEVTGFKIVDEMIYFTDWNHCLYQVPLTGGTAEKLTAAAVGDYEVLQGKVYYTLKDSNNQLFSIGREESINPGGQVKNLDLQNVYLVAIFDKTSESPAKMMIINADGKVIYKTMENVLLVRIENGKVVFVKDN